MQYSIGVEYALHCLTYLVTNSQPDVCIGVKELATYQGVSETYLSKIFTKLKKAGIVRSVLGTKGGYELSKRPEDISFWDVIQAIEGVAPLFQCKEIRQKSVLNKDGEVPDFCHSPCTIRKIMDEAEDLMRQYLKAKTLRELTETLQERIPKERQEETKAWFQEALRQR
ncbi:RrF2 family transcriptional regulator [Brevibacillus ginsengisoli]|uniref:RrF2 family transcriptional regulator n=1 Tax=Brevibacillus ginsengisoli TaxID=363854 RepID=UPI003CE9FB29